MYGIQTSYSIALRNVMFENDVKMYGIQTTLIRLCPSARFENDVKMYGIQTAARNEDLPQRLRMM